MTDANSWMTKTRWMCEFLLELYSLHPCEYLVHWREFIQLGKQSLGIWMSGVFFLLLVVVCVRVLFVCLFFVLVPRRVWSSMDKENAFVPGILAFCSINNRIILFIAIIKERKTFVMNTININGYKSLSWLPCTVQPASQTAEFPKQWSCFSQAFQNRVQTPQKVISVANNLKSNTLLGLRFSL